MCPYLERYWDWGSKLNNESGNIYTGEFPDLNSNSLIEYFITATNLDGNIVSHPNAGWHLFNTLDFMVGDINQDSSINVQDIIALVNAILSPGSLSDICAADLNGDNQLNVQDIVALVNLILSI